jgi:site-specific DNA-methyltransferase (adenine-specific)
MNEITNTTEPQIAYSECYQLPFVSLYNEDCIETMKRIPDGSIDLMLTDIPYGVTNCDWDIKPNLAIMWHEWERILKPNGVWIFTATQPLTSELVLSRLGFFKYEMIWDKKTTSTPALAKIQPLRSHENVLVFYREQPTYNPILRQQTTECFGKPHAKKSDVSGNLGSDYLTNVGYPRTIIEYMRPNNITKDKGGLHPSQKPVDLMRYLILTYTNKGETVFDGYSGSGTTAEACMIEQRNFIGSELNKEYFDKSVLRLKNVPQWLF